MRSSKCKPLIGKSYVIKYIFQALIDAHDQIGKIWLDRGSGIDEKAAAKEESKDIAEAAESPEENGDMPIETVKVVGLRKVPGQPLGLTVSSMFMKNKIKIKISFLYQLCMYIPIRIRYGSNV